MGRAVLYRVARHGQEWHLVADDTDRSVLKAGDREALVDLAEAIVRDVGGEIVVEGFHDGPEAVIRHPGRAALPDSEN